MTQEFVPYELAVKLKALGFNEPCLGGYIRFRGSGSFELAFYKYRNVDFNTTSNIYVSAPLYQQAFRWFREKYGLFIQPNRTIDSEGTWYYFSIASKRTDVCEGSFVYEEAELACLDKLIEMTHPNK